MAVAYARLIVALLIIALTTAVTSLLGKYWLKLPDLGVAGAAAFGAVLGVGIVLVGAKLKFLGS